MRGKKAEGFTQGKQTKQHKKHKQRNHRKKRNPICGKFSIYENINKQWYTRHRDKCNVQQCKKNSHLKYHKKKGIWTVNGSPCYIPLPMGNKHK